MKKKYFLAIVCAVVIIASIFCGLFFFNRGQNEMQDLILLEQGMKITAPAKYVEKYINAYKKGVDPAILEEILNDILQSPECQTKTLLDSQE